MDRQTVARTWPAPARDEPGQSTWVKDVSRVQIDSGALRRLVACGARGATFSSSSFSLAVSSSRAYDVRIRELAWDDLTALQIYQALMVEDVRYAADLLRPVYERTGGRDGYVSLELAPSVVHDAEAALARARWLWETIDRPNLMVAVPATPQGLIAAETALYEGINVGFNLIFSLDAYRDVRHAYLAALGRRAASGLPVDGVASVAAFPLAPLDARIDDALQRITAGASDTQAGMLAGCLLGGIGIANARAAYREFRETLASPRFARLAALGARPQRLLWTEISPADPAYPANLYSDALVGPDTVIATGPDGVAPLLGREQFEETAALRHDEALHALASLADLGISYAETSRALLEESIQRSAATFHALLAALESARKGVVAVSDVALGAYRDTPPGRSGSRAARLGAPGIQATGQ